MSALVRYVSDVTPLGQMVFFRSAFGIMPVVMIYAWRRELMTAVRTSRPFGHLGRGAISVFGMFFNFAALARLPIVDATAISFASPLITVAFAAIFLEERVRIYRWTAVAVGFAGVIVMLWPHLDLARYTNAATSVAPLGALFALISAFTNAGSVIQTRRLTDTETTSSIVFYFSLFCTIGGLADPAVRLDRAELAAACRAGLARPARRPRAHPAHRELSLRAGLAGRAARLHVDDLGVHARLLVLRRGADRSMSLSAAAIVAALRLVRDLARAPAWA